MKWLRKLFGVKTPAPVQTALDYLTSSDLSDGQSIMLTIKYTHLPRVEMKDAWREISFWKTRAWMIVTPTIRRILLDAHGQPQVQASALDGVALQWL